MEASVVAPKGRKFGTGKIWYREMWHNKIVHILLWYLRTEARGCRVQNH